jgi:hypothetical protein
MTDNYFNKMDSNNVFTTEAHLIYLPNKYLNKSTLNSASSLVCPVYKGKPFKLEDRPPLLTDTEITLMEKIVNGSDKVQDDLVSPKDVILLYDFFRSLFVVYATYNIFRSCMDVHRL